MLTTTDINAKIKIKRSLNLIREAALYLISRSPFCSVVVSYFFLNVLSTCSLSVCNVDVSAINVKYYKLVDLLKVGKIHTKL